MLGRFRSSISVSQADMRERGCQPSIMRLKFVGEQTIQPQSQPPFGPPRRRAPQLSRDLLVALAVHTANTIFDRNTWADFARRAHRNNRPILPSHRQLGLGPPRPATHPARRPTHATRTPPATGAPWPLRSPTPRHPGRYWPQAQRRQRNLADKLQAYDAGKGSPRWTFSLTAGPVSEWHPVSTSKLRRRLVAGSRNSSRYHARTRREHSE
jgi:hypothetical protein